MSEKREENIDNIRGIAIWLMLWGHCIQCMSGGYGKGFEDPAYRFIYSFHMPLFALISGFLLGHNLKKPLKLLVLSRIKSIGIPLLVWGGTPYIIQSFINRSEIDVIDAVNSLWFLSSILFISLYLIFIEYIGKQIALFRVVGYVMGFVFFFLFPYRNFYCFLYPYLVIGILYSKYKDLITERCCKIIELLSVGVFIVMLIFYKREYLIYTTGIFNRYDPLNSLFNDLYRYIIGLAGSISVITIYHLFVFESNRMKKLISVLTVAGEYSLQIYVIQHFLVEMILTQGVNKLCAKLGYNPLMSNPVMYDFVFTLFASILLVVLITSFVKWISNKRISKILFGR